MQLKNLIKPALTGLMGLRPVGTLLHGLGKGHVPIFMLHRFRQPDLGIEGHDVKIVAAALEHLRAQGYEFLAVADVVRKVLADEPLPTRAASFTVDDGYVDQAEIGGPLFSQYDCPATYFVTTGFVDQTLWLWDAKLRYILSDASYCHADIELSGARLDLDLSSPHARRAQHAHLLTLLSTQPIEAVHGFLSRLGTRLGVEVPALPPEHLAAMSWEQARRLERAGMQVGPHSVSHATLSRVETSQSSREIEHSWRRVCEEVTNPCPVFCFPSGRGIDYTQREMSLVRDAGMLGALTATPGYLVKTASVEEMLQIRRFGMPHTLEDFMQYASSAELVKNYLRRGKSSEGGEIPRF